jgi:response regulator of citrate/malate metabolism
MASEGSLTVDLEYGKVGRPTNIYRCKISKFR